MRGNLALDEPRHFDAVARSQIGVLTQGAHDAVGDLLDELADYKGVRNQLRTIKVSGTN
jgi:hypothetical protein